MNFLDYRILITDQEKEEKPLILQNQTTFLSRGNLACITGKAKSCKTFLVSAIIASFLEDEKLTFSKGVKNGKVLHIDTEQSTSHVQNVQQRIYKLSGWDLFRSDDRLVTLALRPLSFEERMNVVSEAISGIKPDLVVIDGIRDLVEDFNDIKSSAKIVSNLMKLSEIYNCGIIVVLHQNKADNNARGHLGTELTNKVETMLQLTSIEGRIIVSPDVSRNNNIQPFAFHINEKELPELCEMPKNRKGYNSTREEVIQTMGESTSMSKQLFVEKYTKLTGKKKSTAYMKIKEAISSGIIKESGDMIMRKEEK